ncbi:hypothetical protein A6A04_13385 [Paramagnetospirillum marisnigri]|uniref:Uncharacterized protein n=1 Tax=Paramagnetospirillum marisnigri TaxID=1285242 RepID=A0A178MUD2_9PROT|nr:hypothetical protein [Paramagnetospirillum marisnigri]OAN53880.1 hypothetical protein A6A04_13385 [Paramagnetospirillum marisnigri]
MNAIAPARLSMPVAAKHRAILAESLNGSAPTIADNDPLIPAEECRAIVAEMTAALGRCDPEIAAKHARLIVASYGGQKPDDPDGYIRMITTSVAQCPPDLLTRLVDEVPRRHPRYLPSKGEVDAVVSDLTRPRSNARQIAQAHIAAHAKRDTAGDEAKRHAAWEARLSPSEREALARVREARARGESIASLIGGNGPNAMPLHPQEARR